MIERLKTIGQKVLAFRGTTSEPQRLPLHLRALDVSVGKTTDKRPWPASGRHARRVPTRPSTLVCLWSEAGTGRGSCFCRREGLDAVGSTARALRTGRNYSILSYFETATTSRLSRLEKKRMDSVVSVFPDTSNLLFRSLPTQAGIQDESNLYITKLPSIL